MITFTINCVIDLNLELTIFALEGLSHSPHRRHDVSDDDGAAVAGGDAGGEALVFEPYVAVPDHRGTHHWLASFANVINM